MNMLRVTLFGLLLCLSGSALIACSDDDGDGGDSGDGDSGDGDSGDGDSGDGDGGDGDGGDGDSGDGDSGDGDTTLTKAQCLDMSLSIATEACLDCTCEADAEATVACGEGCWNFLVCITEHCDGDFSDGACINNACGDIEVEEAGGPAAAMVLGPAFANCSDVCGAHFGDDAGTDDQDGGR